MFLTEIILLNNFFFRRGSLGCPAKRKVRKGRCSFHFNRVKVRNFSPKCDFLWILILLRNLENFNFELVKGNQLYFLEQWTSESLKFGLSNFSAFELRSFKTNFDWICQTMRAKILTSNVKLSYQMSAYWNQIKLKMKFEVFYGEKPFYTNLVLACSIRKLLLAVNMLSAASYSFPEQSDSADLKPFHKRCLKETFC